MATYRGMDGSFTFATNVVGEITSWSATVNLELLDSSKMGDKWQKNRTGMGSWSGQLTCHFDYGDTLGQKAIIDKVIAAVPADSSFAAELIASAGKKITGNIVITGVQVGAQLGSVIPVTLTFTGDGPPVLAWV